MVYMYHSFLSHSSADGHLGCFHVLAIINSAAMNIGVHVSLSDLVSSVCMPRSGIAGSYSSSISSFLRNQGGHFLPHKYIKGISTFGVSSTKQLLNTGRGPQIPREANQSLQNEVGQKIKTKVETKDLGTDTCPEEGILKEEKFPLQ